MSLDSKATQFTIVINIPKNRKDLDIEKLNIACNQMFKEYSYIKHDKDYIKDGILKTTHYHLVSKGSRVRLITVINRLSSYLDIDTTLISCKKCVSYIGSLQYLIHKNDLDKYQYSLEDIVSNIEREDLRTILTSDNDDISLDRIINIIQNCRSLTEVIKEVGMSKYIGYRNLIIDLWRDRNNYYEK